MSDISHEEMDQLGFSRINETNMIYNVVLIARYHNERLGNHLTYYPVTPHICVPRI